MLLKLFKSFREWVCITRRKKGLKKPARSIDLVGARASCRGDGPSKAASGEIITRLESALAEFGGEQGSPEASWLNIQQLTEPLVKQGELISTSPI
jgi:hypothetical protein